MKIFLVSFSNRSSEFFYGASFLSRFHYHITIIIINNNNNMMMMMMITSLPKK